MRISRKICLASIVCFAIGVIFLIATRLLSVVSSDETTTPYEPLPIGFKSVYFGDNVNVVDAT